MAVVGLIGGLVCVNGVVERNRGNTTTVCTRSVVGVSKGTSTITGNTIITTVPRRRSLDGSSVRVWRLAGNLWGFRDTGGQAGGADTEDVVLPPITAPSLVLVFGSPGGDAAGELDILEHRVFRGNSHLRVLVGNLRLSLLLASYDFLLEGLVVAGVDVMNVLGVRVGLELSLDLLLLLVDAVTESIEVAKSLADLLLQHLDDDGLQNLEKKGLEEAEQSLVLRLLELYVQVADSDLGIVNLEEAGAVVLVGGRELELEAEALAAKEDVADTSVSDGGEALLALDVVADVPQVALDLRGGDHHRLLALAVLSLASEAEVGVVTDLKDVGHQVITLKYQILDNSVKRTIRVLDAGHRDVANALEDVGKHDLGDVLDEMLLEGWLAVLIVAKIVEQLLERLSEPVVVGIDSELITHEPELVHDAVGVVAVAVAEQIVSLLVELVVLASGVGLHNVTLFLETAADVAVDRAEPVLEFGVIIGIAVDVVDSTHQVVSTSVVGETLDENLEVMLGLMQVGVLAGSFNTTDTLGSCVLSVAGVGLCEMEESVDGFSVVLVALDLDDHLLETPDSLLAAVLGHLLLEIVLGAVAVLATPLLLVFGRVLVDTTLEIVNPLAEAGRDVDTSVGSLALVLSGDLGSLARVPGSIGVGSLGHVSSDISKVIAIDGLVAVNLLTELLFEVVPRKVGGVMPLMVGGGGVDVVELILRRVHAASSLGSSIAANSSKEYNSVIEEFAELPCARRLKK